MLSGESFMKENVVTERAFRLLPLQQGMMFYSLAEAESGVYVGHAVCRLGRETDLAAIVQAWAADLARHEALRISFYWEGLQEPLQRVHNDVVFRLDVRDWKHVKADELQSALDEYLLVDRCSPFKLDVPPLMRFTLLAPAEGDYIFVWTLHHGLLDGRSRVLVLKEVALLYETFRRKET